MKQKPRRGRSVRAAVHEALGGLSPPPITQFKKLDVARARSVCTRTIDIWVKRGLMPPPIKLGTNPQSRVRFTAEQLAILDRNLALLGRAPPADRPAAGI